VDTVAVRKGKIAASGGQIEGRSHELQACKLLTVWITPVDKLRRVPDVHPPDRAGMGASCEPQDVLRPGIGQGD
jgi:hypothetical protein